MIAGPITVGGDSRYQITVTSDPAQPWALMVKTGRSECAAYLARSERADLVGEIVRGIFGTTRRGVLPSHLCHGETSYSHIMAAHAEALTEYRAGALRPVTPGDLAESARVLSTVPETGYWARPTCSDKDDADEPQCYLCDHTADHGHDLTAKRMYDSSLDLKIIGRVCDVCRLRMIHNDNRTWDHCVEYDVDARTALYGTGRDPMSMAARAWRASAHRCDLCHIGFDSPRRLSIHKQTQSHRAVEWIEYQIGLGNIVLRPGSILSHALTRALLLAPNTPSRTGWLWTPPDNVANDDRMSDDSKNRPQLDNRGWLAIPHAIFDGWGTALVRLYSLEADRIRSNTGWSSGSEKSHRVLRAAMPLLFLVTLRQQGILPPDLSWPRLPWGLGPVLTDGTLVSNQIAHAIHEARREVWNSLGASFFQIAHAIWGKYDGRLPAWTREPRGCQDKAALAST